MKGIIKDTPGGGGKSCEKMLYFSQWEDCKCSRKLQLFLQKQKNIYIFEWQGQKMKRKIRDCGAGND